MRNKKKLTLVSVIITTKNSARTLEKLLGSINNQSYGNIETIVVDNNSTDDTKTIARLMGVVCFNKGPERSAQRNFGVLKTKGKYILVLDSDMILTKNVVAECVREIHGRNNFSAIVIPERSIGTGFWTKIKVYEREFYLGEEAIEAARFFKKSVFNKFGGYDTSMTGPEDWDLPLRMRNGGEKIGRIKSFVLHDEGKFSPFYSAKKKFYYAASARKYFKKHPEMIASQGNLIFKPVFFKKWRKLIGHPFLALSMFFMRSVEMFGAILGFFTSSFKK